MPHDNDKRVRANHHVSPIHTSRMFEDGQIVIAREVASDENILAVVAIERLGNPHLVALGSNIISKCRAYAS